MIDTLQNPWQPMKNCPKNKSIILLGRTDTTSDFYYEIKGKYDKDLECFVTKGGWVIAAVAWRKM